ncbi:pyrimidine utilization protein D [Sphingomonas sanxanigenens]|uniref:pyrimidine utilization protein D n=1 Tax=Sphingomonas sanxanigenens TaxID=397260 RepID=UPI001B8090EC|nr:pyrimidine utilization protein D [Sphingomonas sanxanigenens]
MVIDGLHVEIHGAEDAPAVLLSPGLGGSGGYWAPQVAVLAERHRVILYDHRGTGRSDRHLPDASVAAMGDDMARILDGLGIASAAIVGHAAGGIAGLALALKAPGRVDRLVLVNGWARAERHFLRCFETRLALLRGTGVEAYVRAQPLFLYPAAWIAEHFDALEDEAAHIIAGFPGIDTVERRIAALAAFDETDRLADCMVPVLALASEDDMLVPWRASRALAEGLPNGQFALLPRGGHACNVTEPAAFAAAVLPFLTPGT